MKTARYRPSTDREKHYYDDLWACRARAARLDRIGAQISSYALQARQALLNGDDVSALVLLEKLPALHAEWEAA